MPEEVKAAAKDSIKPGYTAMRQQGLPSED